MLQASLPTLNKCSQELLDSPAMPNPAGFLYVGQQHQQQGTDMPTRRLRCRFVDRSQVSTEQHINFLSTSVACYWCTQATEQHYTADVYTTVLWNASRDHTSVMVQTILTI